MKRLLLPLLFAVAAFGQPAAPVVTVAADPSGDCVAHVSQQFNERNGKQWACVDTTGVGYGTWTWINQGTAGGVADPGGNGVMKRTALDVTAPAAALDIIAPFTGTKDASHCTAGDGTMQACGTSGSANPAEFHTVTFSATPALTPTSSTAGTSDTFTLSTALSANISPTATLANFTPGQEVVVILKQAASGGPYSVTWPTGWTSAPNVSPIANSVTTFKFVYDSGASLMRLTSAAPDSGPGIILLQSAPSSPPGSGLIFMWGDTTNTTLQVEDSSSNIYSMPRQEACTNQVVTALGTNGRITCGPPFTLTTTGNSGPATLSAGTLNVPQYPGGGGGSLRWLNLSPTGAANSASVGGGPWQVEASTGWTPVTNGLYTAGMMATHTGTPTTYAFIRLPYDMDTSQSVDWIFSASDKDSAGGNSVITLAIACYTTSQNVTSLPTFGTALSSGNMTLSNIWTEVTKTGLDMTSGSCAAGSPAVLKMIRDNTASSTSNSISLINLGLRYTRN